MTLTGSGQISFNDIRVELNVPSQAPFSIRSASAGVYGTIQACQSPRPNTNTPDSLSEWWGYNHSATASLAYDFITEQSPTSCAVACALLDGADEKRLLAYSLSSNPTVYFGDTYCLTELSNQGYFAVDQTTCYTVTANSITTSACTTTTTTTTTTTLTCACNFKTGVCTSGCSNAGFACGDNTDCA